MRKISVRKTYNLDNLYRNFINIYNEECGCNEGNFNYDDLKIVIKLIDFFKENSTYKEQEEILLLLESRF